MPGLRRRKMGGHGEQAATVGTLGLSSGSMNARNADGRILGAERMTTSAVSAGQASTPCGLTDATSAWLRRRLVS